MPSMRMLLPWSSRFGRRGFRSSSRALAFSTSALISRSLAPSKTGVATCSPSAFAGNYWDGYAGYDLDHDGFGDAPYHPVRLFSVLVEQNEPMLILLRSFFLDLLDAAERLMPVITPDALVDAHPLMRWTRS